MSNTQQAIVVLNAQIKEIRTLRALLPTHAANFNFDALLKQRLAGLYRDLATTEGFTNAVW